MIKYFFSKSRIEGDSRKIKVFENDFHPEYFLEISLDKNKFTLYNKNYRDDSFF